MNSPIVAYIVGYLLIGLLISFLPFSNRAREAFLEEEGDNFTYFSLDFVNNAYILLFILFWPLVLLDLIRGFLYSKIIIPHRINKAKRGLKLAEELLEFDKEDITEKQYEMAKKRIERLKKILYSENPEEFKKNVESLVNDRNNPE